MKQTMYTLICVFLSLGTQLQAQTHNGEIIFHFIPGTTNQEVTDMATNWNSTVVQPLQTGGQIAVLKANYYPFPNPYDPNDIIVNINGQKDKTIIFDPDGDGGVENYYIIKDNIPNSGPVCNYNTTHTLGQTAVSVGIFDSGTNWEAANNNGFTFNNVYEVDGDATDKDGHGTHVATSMQNTFAQSPVNLKEQLTYTLGNPLDNNGSGILADLVYSIEESIIHGDNVINCSFSYVGSKEIINNGSLGESYSVGGLFYAADPLLQVMLSSDPVKTLFVCAAGNDEYDMDGPGEFTFFPAAFPMDNILTVASHDCDGTLSTFSNFGSASVDIATTGVNIEGLDDEMNLIQMTGTSQATAIVSGAAIIVGSYLNVFDAPNVKCAIMSSAQFDPALDGLVLSNGLLDIPQAVMSINCTGGGAPAKREKNGLQSKITVTPNPFDDHIRVQFDLQAAQSVSYKIYDISGRMISHSLFSGQKGENSFDINFDNFTFSNYYILRLESNEFTRIEKLIRF